jgi:hypothetical protein
MEFMKYTLPIGYSGNCTIQLLIAFGLSLDDPKGSKRGDEAGESC